MQIGVLLPSFHETADEALRALDEAEAVGLHGAFLYDHLWPLGEPGKPAISPYPLLGALAARRRDLRLGTLVARVGLVPDEVLVAELLTVQALSGDRLIAGVGTGDRESAAENRAYGIDFAPTALRQRALRHVVETLLSAGIEAWVGGGRPATNAVARRTGATLNLWARSPAAVAKAAEDGPVSWAGSLPADRREAGERLLAFRDAGASWAVATWPGSLEPLLAATEQAGISLRR